MLIYQGTSKQFHDDVLHNRITDIMSENFQDQLGSAVQSPEFMSWQNSLGRIKDLMEIADLSDNYVALEYQVPYNDRRIDCLLFGKNSKTSNIYLIELKQWTKVYSTQIEGNYVETYTGGGKRTVAHPSQQVKGYHNYLLDFVEEFEIDPPLKLYSCSYCHNYSHIDESGLFDPIYNRIVSEYPVYCKEDVDTIAMELREKLANGEGFEVFNRFMRSRIRPSKKLLENVRDIIENGKEYSLINEQLVAKNVIWSKVRKSIKKSQKSVVIVRGGPGTGKSIIALNVLAEVASRKLSSIFVCKSKPFREGLQKLVGGRAKNLFTNPYFLVPAKTEENGLDVIFIDEAHRLEKSNVHRYMKPEHRSDLSQVDQIIRAGKTSVFFIDDKQSVRNLEIGTSEYIREAARNYGVEIEEVELLSQFRCMGSNNYLTWIESLLGYGDEIRILKKNEIFDFRIFDTPDRLYNALKEKEQEKQGSARLVAGFCWPWSDPRPDGTLVKDVKIENFEMPWETKGDHGVDEFPPWYQWALKPKGFEQVGCIYTAQGFEFDYIGVIIGNDLQFDKENQRLFGDIKYTRDPTLKRDTVNFNNYVKNIYRVLLTRGMKGCFVYFINKEVEEFFRSKLE